MTIIEEMIYKYIPEDRNITRKELKKLTGLDDRTIRNIISKIRLEHTIISLSSQKGYRKARNTNNMSYAEKLHEINIMRHAINENNSRIKNLKKVMRSQIAYLKILEKEIEDGHSK